MSLRVIAYPTVEPITIEEARDHLNLVPYGSPPEHWKDSAILRQLPTARRYCEQYLGFSVAQKTLELALDAFPSDEIELPMGPVLSIESVKYIDEDGDEQTMDESGYVLDNSEQAWLLPADTWPATKSVINAMKIRYLVGHSAPGDSPQEYPVDPMIRSAILLVLGSLMNQPEDSSEVKQENIPLGVAALLDLAGRTRRGFA